MASIARLKSTANQPERQLLSVYLQRGVIRFIDVEEKRTNVTSQDLSRYQVVDPGDFVLNNQQAWRGSVGVSNFSGIVSPAYLVLSLSKCFLTEYANYLFRDQCMVSQYLICSKGVGTIQRNLYWPYLKRVTLVIPPTEDQAAIIRFLNWANARIDRAIRAKRKVIKLLNEEKQAIIHRAVTRGLDPKAPLKPSGVPWLGDIPVHWELRRLKSVLLRNDGGVWGTDFTPEGTMVLRSTEQAMDGSWQIREPAVIRLSESQFNAAVLFAGDIVLTKSSGSASHIGKASLVTSEIAEMKCCYSNFMQRLRTTSELEPKYLHIFLNSQTGRSHYHYTATSTTGLGNLTRETIATLQIPLPSKSEQIRILSTLRERITPLDSSISRLECEIELLGEYRTRLIADVVTGKLDVREAATRLLDDISLDTTNDEDLGDETEMPDQENCK